MISFRAESRASLPKVILVMALVLAVWALTGCGGSNPMDESPEDAYRAGFAKACEDSGADDRFDCQETADRTVNPNSLGDADPYASGYVEACDNFYPRCPRDEYRRERRQISKSLEN